MRWCLAWVNSYQQQEDKQAGPQNCDREMQTVWNCNLTCFEIQTGDIHTQYGKLDLLVSNKMKIISFVFQKHCKCTVMINNNNIIADSRP